jgi:hypothetical protein
VIVNGGRDKAGPNCAGAEVVLGIESGMIVLESESQRWR